MVFIIVFQPIDGKVVCDLGSGTGIGGLAVLKFANASRVIMTDYSEEVNQLLLGNIKLQGKLFENRAETLLIDWTKPEHYDRIAGIDIAIATDVIYKGSPYKELADLMSEIAVK